MAGGFLDSEYRSLRSVLLCKPPPGIGSVADPGSVLYQKKVDAAAINEEFRGIVGLYKRLKIKTYFIDTSKIKNTGIRHLFNIMFTRDIFFMTGRGAVISRMACSVRRQEPRYAERALRHIGIGIRKAIYGNATFEGADALWINPRLVAVAVGNRTDHGGFIRLKRELKRDNVECVCLPAPSGVLHLLGALQIVDKGLALVRAGLVKPAVFSLLRQNKVEAIEVPENEEIRDRQAFNFVTIAPRKIVMPAACPRTKKTFKRYKIEVAGEIPITQFANAGGGLACATGVLARARY